MSNYFTEVLDNLNIVNHQLINQNYLYSKYILNNPINNTNNAINNTTNTINNNINNNNTIDLDIENLIYHIEFLFTGKNKINYSFNSLENRLNNSKYMTLSDKNSCLADWFPDNNFSISNNKTNIFELSDIIAFIYISSLIFLLVKGVSSYKS